MVRSFDATARNALAAGERVVLVCDGRRPLARTVGAGSRPISGTFNSSTTSPAPWAFCLDPASPALAQFPTESHSDWQWFQLTLHAQPLILDTLMPAGDRPMVQVIEITTGTTSSGSSSKPGSVRDGCWCAAPTCRPWARRTRKRANCSPASSPMPGRTGSIRARPCPLERSRAVPRDRPDGRLHGDGFFFEDSWQNFTPPQLIDGNESRGWHADPHASSNSCARLIPKPTDLHGGEILWDEDKPGYKYIVESSTDGTHWEMLCDGRENKFREARHQLAFTGAGVRFVRITISAVPYDHAPAINEVRFLRRGVRNLPTNFAL